MTGYSPDVSLITPFKIHVGDQVIIERKSKLIEAVVEDIYPDVRNRDEATNVRVRYKTWWGEKHEWINGYYVKGIRPEDGEKD